MTGANLNLTFFFSPLSTRSLCAPPAASPGLLLRLRLRPAPSSACGFARPPPPSVLRPASIISFFSLSTRRLCSPPCWTL